MADRKVLNFYYSKDFDPSLVPKRKFNEQIKIRIMLPFSLQCNTCGAFTYKGKKFNGRKEDSQERYLGIPIYRFYFRCPNCAAQLTFKTDPKNADYTCEWGATRTFDVGKAKIEAEAALAKQKLEEEKGDAMKQVENRTLASKREMEDMEELEEMLEQSSSRGTIDLDKLRETKRKEAEEEMKRQQEVRDAEDEDEVKQLLLSRKAIPPTVADISLATKDSAVDEESSKTSSGNGKKTWVKSEDVDSDEVEVVDDEAEVEEDFSHTFAQLNVQNKSNGKNHLKSDGINNSVIRDGGSTTSGPITPAIQSAYTSSSSSLSSSSLSVRSTTLPSLLAGAGTGLLGSVTIAKPVVAAQATKRRAVAVTVPVPVSSITTLNSTTSSSTSSSTTNNDSTSRISASNSSTNGDSLDLGDYGSDSEG